MPEELNLQVMEALTKANTIRTARASDKKKIKRGQLDPLEILNAPPEHWENAPVVDLLLAMNRVGRARAGKWLLIEKVRANMTLGQMNHSERYRLAWYIEREELRRRKRLGLC